MSSAQGRFTSPDPISGTALHLINPQRWNMYAYGLNNPLFYTDPDGRDAIAVNLSKQVFLAGHAGVISVHQDGTAVYAREGPLSDGVPIGANEIQTLPLPNVEFGADRLPTAASWNTLAEAIGSFEKQDPGSINFAYFKTSEADTLALDNFLRAEQQPRISILYLRTSGFAESRGESAGRISGEAIPGAKRSPLRVAARDRRRGGGPAIDPMHSLAEAYPADRRRSSTPKMIAPSPQMMSSMPSMPAEDSENYVF